MNEIVMSHNLLNTSTDTSSISNNNIVNNSASYCVSKPIKSSEEIFTSLANTIRSCHDQEITEQESRKIAKKFIGFCQKIIEIQTRLEKEKK